ncbi:MAG: putative RDD family membrane protein YckC [Parasphingorhabdus sp.]|jgi:uncharacterized RDD family membrane protein YckC
MKNTQNKTSTKQYNVLPAGIFRRLGSMLYDIVLLFGVLFVFAIPVSLLDPLTRELTFVEWGIRVYYLSVIATYFSWFWSHGGQTLGMRAWKLHVVDKQSSGLTFGLGLQRFLAATISLAPAGLGLLWILFQNDKTALHDKISGTRIQHRKIV